METLNEQCLRELKILGPNWEDANIEQFTDWANTQKKEVLEIVLDKTRRTRDFYKNILLEEYYKKHPSDYRYNSASERVKFFNARGKMLKELITNYKN